MYITVYETKHIAKSLSVLIKLIVVWQLLKTNWLKLSWTWKLVCDISEKSHINYRLIESPKNFIFRKFKCLQRFYL